jgi:hypothetical protein
MNRVQDLRSGSGVLEYDSMSLSNSSSDMSCRENTSSSSKSISVAAWADPLLAELFVACSADLSGCGH